ncbi:MAG: CDP-alcohol phosphatidyltransferase family protein [Calditrichia bacterium]
MPAATTKIFEKGKVWTLSNFMSLSRIILAVVLYFVILERQTLLALLISFVAVITDYADGWFARKLNQVSELGKILDPIADKMAVGLGSIALHYAYGLPGWVVVIILGRDILILLGSLLILGKKKMVIASAWPGKIAVTLISFLLISYFTTFETLKLVLEIAAVLGIFYSLGYYFWVFIKNFKNN